MVIGPRHLEDPVHRLLRPQGGPTRVLPYLPRGSIPLSASVQAIGTLARIQSAREALAADSVADGSRVRAILWQARVPECGLRQLWQPSPYGGCLSPLQQLCARAPRPQ